MQQIKQYMTLPRWQYQDRCLLQCDGKLADISKEPSISVIGVPEKGSRRFTETAVSLRLLQGVTCHN